MSFPLLLVALVAAPSLAAPMWRLPTAAGVQHTLEQTTQPSLQGISQIVEHDSMPGASLHGAATSSSRSIIPFHARTNEGTESSSHAAQRGQAAIVNEAQLLKVQRRREQDKERRRRWRERKRIAATPGMEVPPFAANGRPPVPRAFADKYTEDELELIFHRAEELKTLSGRRGRKPEAGTPLRDVDKAAPLSAADRIILQRRLFRNRTAVEKLGQAGFPLDALAAKNWDEIRPAVMAQHGHLFSRAKPAQGVSAASSSRPARDFDLNLPPPPE